MAQPETHIWFSLLVIGIEKYLTQSKSTVYPYPIELQHAMNYIAAHMANFPKTFAHFLDMLDQPLQEWWVGAVPESIDPRLPLLYKGQLTNTTEDYLLNENLEGLDTQHLLLQLENEPFREFYEEKRQAYQQAADDQECAELEAEYAGVREFLIRNPFTTPPVLRQTFLAGAQRIAAFYTPVQDSLSLYKAKQRYWACPACGIVTKNKANQPVSMNLDVCNNRCPGSHSWQATPPEPHLQVVNSAILKRVVIPGLVELALYDRLQELSTQYKTLTDVRLYPGIDAYDLRIAFADGQIWAVDVKDYREPLALGKKIARPPHAYTHDERLRWDHFFYVIPDERERDHPGYRERVMNEAGWHLPIMTVTQFYKQAESKAWEID